MEKINKIKKNMNKNQQYLSEYACKDIEAYRFNLEEEDIRPPFYRDTDRIIHCLSYTRYMDKTQVFSKNKNTNISKRMVHVQLVSKIARTIGRALNLNEDLIEAAALGHDLGHTPFGHVGEQILNKISIEEGEGFFNHNIQSVRNLMCLEKQGKGLNLNIQVLDAIMCHNGEIALGVYKPIKKTKEQFLDEYKVSYEDKEVVSKLRPMTLEGCVVRISDIIGYLGRDIEDAISLGVIKRKDIPETIIKFLGKSNKDLINNIITDILVNSIDKSYIKLSEPVYKAIIDLKKFNYEKIYNKANTKEDIKKYQEMFRKVYISCLNDLNFKNTDSKIYIDFLDYMVDEYKKNNSNRRIVIDYMAGMTDEYFYQVYEDIV